MTKTIIDLTRNGLPGVLVETSETPNQLDAMAESLTVSQNREQASELRKTLQAAFPYIRRGERYYTGDEWIDQNNWGEYCLLLAVNDPGAGNQTITYDTVHGHKFA